MKSFLTRGNLDKGSGADTGGAQWDVSALEEVVEESAGSKQTVRPGAWTRGDLAGFLPSPAPRSVPCRFPATSDCVGCARLSLGTSLLPSDPVCVSSTILLLRLHIYVALPDCHHHLIPFFLFVVLRMEPEPHTLVVYR